VVFAIAALLMAWDFIMKVGPTMTRPIPFLRPRPAAGARGAAAAGRTVPEA
jgi:hypothetical protein